MANPTSNFGWQMPTPTDLVTDLPADFEVFGQAVDTSMADLKGGTTDQVLAKNSNTDMDFKWVTSDDANAIQNTIVDAKGDLIAASASDVPARLAVGANGETLVADSSTSTGLRYTAGTVQANPILNSAFQVWQRGTSIATGAAQTYGADRWQTYRSGNVAGSTVSRQVTGDTTNLPFVQYCARVQRDSGNTSTAFIQIAQSLETINSIPFAGKTVTMSFYARKGADFSSASSNLQYRLNYGTGTDQNINGTYTGNVSIISNDATLTTTWQRFSTTATIAATATEMAVRFQYTPVGTAGAADYFEFTGVQVDIGSVALPFRTNAGTIQGELDACQRYCELITPKNDGLPYAAANGTSSQGETIQFHVAKRIAASVTLTAGTVEWWNGSTWNSVAPSLSAGIDNFGWAINTGTSSVNRLIRQNGATYLATAEL
jgi:hypothetical protein